MREQLERALEAEPEDVFDVDGLLDLNDLWEIVEDPRLPGAARPAVDAGDAAAAAGRRVRGGRRHGARCARATSSLHHPYDSFSTSVERLVEEAVSDPDVLAIKQTVYRTSDDSPLVPALIRAAERGKQAVCLVELKARFDERANITWARALEEAGVHVVYGLPSLKTHASASSSSAARATACATTSTSGPATTTRRRRASTPTSGCSPATSAIGADVADMFNFLTGFGAPAPLPPGAGRARAPARRDPRRDRAHDRGPPRGQARAHRA